MHLQLMLPRGGGVVVDTIVVITFIISVLLL